MKPLKPMLAVAMKHGNVIDWRDWCVEEKLDGHRLIVRVFKGASGGKRLVTAYTRPRRRASGEKSMAERVLPEGLRDQLAKLPVGVYDGELVGGDISTDVTRLDLQDKLGFVLFDILEHGGTSTCSRDYVARKLILGDIWAMLPDLDRVTLIDSHRVTKESDVRTFVERVWKRGGEGAILKRMKSIYHPGKRSEDWIKVKRSESAVLTVVGFEPTRGEVMDRGPYAIVILEDEDGNTTTVKTRNDEELERFNEQAKQMTARQKAIGQHPAIGRKLRIDFQQRTRSGGYRGPVIWDRWEDE